MVREKSVPTGYKKTEVGVIPEDWEVKRLGDCTVSNPEYGINAPAVKYNESLPTYLRITDISGDGRFIDSDKRSVVCKNISRYLLSEGDLVFARTGASVGKTYLYESRDGRLAFAGYLIRVKTNQEELVPRFLKSYTETAKYWNWVKTMSMRSGQPGISGKEYSRLPIPLPPLPEQKAIAKVLSDVDRLIVSIEKLIDKKRNIKQSTMQLLLTGKKRLPGFTGEWEVKDLEEIARIVNGGTPSTKNTSYWDGDIKWCTPTDITKCKGKYLKDTESKITRSGLDNSSATLLPKGTLLLCSRATVGELRIAYDEIATNQGFKSLVCGNRVYSEYLYYYMTIIKDKLIEKASGSTFLEISKKDIASITIELPSLPEQKAIAQILSDMDSEIEALEKKLHKYKLIKEGMMEKLLTGKVRLV